MTYIITLEGITMRIQGKTYQVASDHRNFDTLKEGLLSESLTEDEAINLATEEANTIRKYVSGDSRIHIQDGVLYYKDNVLHNSLSDRIVKMQEKGADYTYLVNFLENMFENPATSSRNELFEFLEKNTLPITPEGYFLAYKRVREDYTDVHSGTYDNSPGSIVEMSRENVDPDRNTTCSTGLHFASWDYVSGFYSGNSPIVIVKINPRDVVSIPVDYDNAKGRCCRYEVVAVLPGTDERLIEYVVSDNYQLFQSDETEDMYEDDEDEEGFLDDFVGDFEDDEDEEEEGNDFDVMYLKRTNSPVFFGEVGENEGYSVTHFVVGIGDQNHIVDMNRTAYESFRWIMEEFKPDSIIVSTSGKLYFDISSGFNSNSSLKDQVRHDLISDFVSTRPLKNDSKYSMGKNRVVVHAPYVVAFYQGGIQSIELSPKFTFTKSKNFFSVRLLRERDIRVEY